MEEAKLKETIAGIPNKSSYSIDFTNVPQLRTDWCRLFEKSGSDNPFLTWDWNLRWIQAFGDQSKCNVVVLRHQSEVVALSLLSNTPKLHFYGDPFFADYANFLVHPDHIDALDFVYNALFMQDDFKGAVFEPLRSDEAATVSLSSFAELNKLHWRATKLCPNPVVDTTNSFEEVFRARRKSLRQDVKTSANHLNRLGGWSFQVAQNTEQANAIFHALVEFHLQRQFGKVGNSIFITQQNIAFFEALIKSPAQGYRVHLSAIYVGDRIVSAAYSIVCGDTFYYWIPSFDQTVPSVSLGKLHIKCLIEECCASHVKIFDFMGGGEPYKYQWADQEYSIIRFSIFANQFQARLMDFRTRLRSFAKDNKDQAKFLQSIWRKISKFGNK
ncbi:MAG: GNAT family N-acetyltransferase [Hyphomicrobiales bacterium]